MHLKLPPLLTLITLSTSLPLSLTVQPSTSISTIHTFPLPTWLENLSLRPNNQILTTLLGTPSLYLLAPHQNSSAVLLHSFTTQSSLFGITSTEPDIFYLITSTFALTTTNLSSVSYSIYSLSLTNYDTNTNTGAIVQETCLVSGAGMLNGLTTLSSNPPLLLAADSLHGAIYIISPTSPPSSRYRILIQDPSMAAPMGQIGINGLKAVSSLSSPPSSHEKEIRDIYFSNQASASIYYFSLNTSSLLNTTAIQKLTEGVVIDDFAISHFPAGKSERRQEKRERVIYAANGEQNRLIRIFAEGNRKGEWEVVVGGINSTVLAGPTAVAIGKGEEKGKVYVTTNGGFKTPVMVDGVPFREGGKVVRVDVGC